MKLQNVEKVNPLLQDKKNNENELQQIDDILKNIKVMHITFHDSTHKIDSLTRDLFGGIMKEIMP